MLVADAVRTSAGVEEAFRLSDYYPVFLFLGFLILFALGTLGASQLLHWLGLKPYRATAVKLMPYESGMDPVGSARMQFDVKFYLIAILFLVFDVELLFLFPWAALYPWRGAPDEPASMLPFAFQTVVFWEVLVFLVTVVVAYVYAWRRGVFRWR